MKTLLSLFDHSGNWSRPYALAGWNVILWDEKHVADQYYTHGNILDANTDYFYEHIFDAYGTVDGILAAPPCTHFSSSGAQYWKVKDEDGRTEQHVEFVYQVLRIVDLCMPDFWALENPVGRIKKLVPELGDPRYFEPFHYGDPYRKKTGLWGEFNFPEPTNIVEPTENKIMSLGGSSDKTKELRSITPEGFAEAFYQVNH